ncbi:unnamed protein product [Paramecium primaurelia]|uniref:Uncharacterized protein n=1 Tax=Paramecium primaurelia TaxID=5886 RepID=A0A8S1N002_PARPR|nr:unnamed protein product [Paramecium primaurelia]
MGQEFYNMKNIKRQKSIFDQTFSQRATTTAESRRTYKIPLQINDFKNKFEAYLSGQTTCIDVIKYNNSLPTKKYRNSNFTKRKTLHHANTINQQEPIIDYNDIKEFIVDYDQNYTEIKKTLNTQPSLSERKSSNQGLRTYIKSDYQENKRLNHLNLIAEDYRSKIRNNNLVSNPDQLIFKNKIKARTKNMALIRPKFDSAHIQSQIKLLKLENGTKQPIINVYQKLFRTASDHFIDALKENRNVQTSDLHKLGELDFYELEQRQNQLSERLTKKSAQLNRKKKGLKHNKICPQNQIDDCVLDESIISETEAKLNIFYGHSKNFQKKMMNRNENPNKIVSIISKIDQIRENIYKVNKNKLYCQ